MKKFSAITIASLGFSAIVLGGIASCKQGLGERCQVLADCEDGLVCNQAEQKCAESAGGGIDALIPDAPDAMLDGPPDAPDAT